MTATTADGLATLKDVREIGRQHGLNLHALLLVKCAGKRTKDVRAIYRRELAERVEATLRHLVAAGADDVEIEAYFAESQRAFRGINDWLVRAVS